VFAPKITAIALDRFPDHVATPWAREFHQRDAAAAALPELCGEDDLVLITDVDEIVDARALEGFDGDFARLHMPLHRYFLNYRPAPKSPQRNGRAGAIWRAGMLAGYGLSYARARLSRLEKDWARIPAAGWHFSSLGGAEEVARKQASYAHQERAHAAGPATELEALLGQLQGGQAEEGWERCDVDDSFPAYIREHQDELAALILPPAGRS
jgi:beta-1,4-mannosyl-glycoprotein beta-1,4-N-acetylglucosaminyltransferase